MAASNSERIKLELTKMAEKIPERYGGYRQALVAAAMDCIADTEDHVERRQNIVQRFDGHIGRIAQQFIASKDGNP